jgi:hypothetical protein
MAWINKPKISGTSKSISWAVKIRAELINKVDYLKSSLKFNNDIQKEKSDLVFGLFLEEWQQEV